MVMSSALMLPTLPNPLLGSEVVFMVGVESKIVWDSHALAICHCTLDML